MVGLGQHCPLLRSLKGLGWGPITDAAVTALVHGCPQLEVVELPYAALMTDASASALAQGCPNLSTLNLFGTGVTAAGVRTLAKHAKQKLTIRADCMSASEARALEEEYPVEVNRLNIQVITQGSNEEGFSGDPGEMINIKVINYDGNEIYFQMRNTTSLKYLMDAFCNHQGVSEMSSIRFLFDGNRINERQTPVELDMVDGDVIDVFTET